MKSESEKYWKDEFYKSKAWQKKREEIIERDLGICQHCHKLILESPHVHHIIELTEENYKDPKIALNDDNLITLHKDCHDAVHERFQLKSSIVDNNFEIDYSKR